MNRNSSKILFWICAAVVLWTNGAAAQDEINARAHSTSMRGPMHNSTDLQFGVRVAGSLDQKIEQLQRETRLLLFSRDNFLPLSKMVNYEGERLPMSQCLAELSKMIGKEIPMNLEGHDFVTGKFTFTDVSLMDALKYLVSFRELLLDVSDGKLVCRPLSQALLLNNAEYQLLQLVCSNRFDEATVLLMQSTTNLNVSKIRTAEGNNLLDLMIQRNQTALAERLIVLGVPVNARGSSGYTPLHAAVRDGRFEFTQLLLSKGADPEIPNNNNDTPLKTAIYYGYRDIASLLVSNGASADIFTASGLGMADRVKKMLDGGADYQQMQDAYLKQLPKVWVGSSIGGPYGKMPGSYLGIYSVSPLHWAALGGSVEVSKLLVAGGESVSHFDSRGETPLFWAASRGQVQVAAFLIMQGADVNATNSFGGTPLLTAARESYEPDLARLLIQSGANVNATDSSGENALHKLAWMGCPDSNVTVAKMLFEAGADISIKNDDGKTPLNILRANDFRNADLVRLFEEQKKNRAQKPL